MSNQNRRNPQAKWVLPDIVNPPESLCFTVRVPKNKFHIAAFRGALYNLTSARFWQDDPAHTALQVAKVWQDIFDSVVVNSCEPNNPVNQGTFVEFNSMDNLIQVICDDTGKCVMQYRCDVCSPWVTAASLGDLQTNPPGTGNQPSPNGGKSSYCKTIYANQTLIIPTPVNTGDLIKITSAKGSWSDQFARWLCIDGNLQFIDCTGVGGAAGAAGDFLMSAYHMSAIVQFSTGYYALYPGAQLVVPSGVVNEQPTILANKPAVASGSGSIDICVEVTNNQTASWTQVFDFTVSPSSAFWSLVVADAGALSGAWSAGAGYVDTQYKQGGNPEGAIVLQCSRAIGNLTNIEVLGNYTYGNTPSGTPPAFDTVVNGTSYGNINMPWVNGAFDVSVPIPNIASTALVVFTQNCTSAPDPCTPGQSKISKIILSGTGVNPFV